MAKKPKAKGKQTEQPLTSTAPPITTIVEEKEPESEVIKGSELQSAVQTPPDNEPIQETRGWETAENDSFGGGWGTGHMDNGGSESFADQDGEISSPGDGWAPNNAVHEELDQEHEHNLGDLHHTSTHIHNRQPADQGGWGSVEPTPSMATASHAAAQAKHTQVKAVSTASAAAAAFASRTNASTVNMDAGWGPSARQQTTGSNKASPANAPSSSTIAGNPATGWTTWGYPSSGGRAARGPSAATAARPSGGHPTSTWGPNAGRAGGQHSVSWGPSAAYDSASAWGQNAGRAGGQPSTAWGTPAGHGSSRTSGAWGYATAAGTWGPAAQSQGAWAPAIAGEWEGDEYYDYDEHGGSIVDSHEAWGRSASNAWGAQQPNKPSRHTWGKEPQKSHKNAYSYLAGAQIAQQHNHKQAKQQEAVKGSGKTKVMQQSQKSRSQPQDAWGNGDNTTWGSGGGDWEGKHDKAWGGGDDWGAGKSSKGGWAGGGEWGTSGDDGWGAGTGGNDWAESDWGGGSDWNSKGTNENARGSKPTRRKKDSWGNTWGDIPEEDEAEYSDDDRRVHFTASNASEAWHPARVGSGYSMPSKTLAHAYKGTTTTLNTGPPRNDIYDYPNFTFQDSRGLALLPAQKAFFGKARFAKDRIHWMFPPDKDERVASLLAWIQTMSYNLGMYGLHKFLQSRERGALLANAAYRSEKKPNEPAFDWLSFDQLQRTLDRTLQTSVAFYDPAVQVIIFVFLPSSTGNSIAIWRRKIRVPNNIRLQLQPEINLAKAGLRKEKDYVVHVDELDDLKKSGSASKGTKSKKKVRWWNIFEW